MRGDRIGNHPNTPEELAVPRGSPVAGPSPELKVREVELTVDRGGPVKVPRSPQRQVTEIETGRNQNRGQLSRRRSVQQNPALKELR